MSSVVSYVKASRPSLLSQSRIRTALSASSGKVAATRWTSSSGDGRVGRCEVAVSCRAGAKTCWWTAGGGRAGSAASAVSFAASAPKTTKMPIAKTRRLKRIRRPRKAFDRVGRFLPSAAPATLAVARPEAGSLTMLARRAPIATRRPTVRSWRRTRVSTAIKLQAGGRTSLEHSSETLRARLRRPPGRKRISTGNGRVESPEHYWEVTVRRE